MLSWVARRALRPSWPFPLRQGIASLYRPGNQTRAVVLALGFGVFLMGTLYQVQHNILRSLGVRLGEARANVVFFDVQESQRPGDRFDRPRQPHRDDRRDADRPDAHRVDQRTVRSSDIIAEVEKTRRAAASSAAADGGGGSRRRDAARTVGAAARIPLDVTATR